MSGPVFGDGPVFGGDAAQTREQVEQWAAGIEAKAARYQEMQQQVTAVTATASSRDGNVKVTVDSGGTLTDLQISDDIRKLSGADISSAIMTTLQQAQSKISGQVAEAMAATVGDDTETVSAIVSAYQQRFPEPEPDSADTREDPPPDDGDFSNDTYLR